MKTIKNNGNKKGHTIIGLVYCFILSGFINLHAQNNTKDINKPVYEHFTPYPDSMKVYVQVDTMPKFPGNINKYFADSIQYPEDAKVKKISGTVYLGVIIEKDGSISNIRIWRSYNSSMSMEAKRVVATMPKWLPGIQSGKPVRVQYMIPVHFNLPPASGGK